ncbi:MAG: LysR family transcriptional regulator, partial [Oscillospiraceae bacterium]|nr:LysR family transcriptional regulator [Oscillospiraceae bacterium]
NLMVGLNGFSIGSGLISEEVNGGDYVVIPLDPMSDTSKNFIEIGYITKKYNVLSDIGEYYIKEINSFLEKAEYTPERSADRAG